MNPRAVDVPDNTARKMLSAGYAPLDVVSYRGRVWHSAGGTAGNVAAILGFLDWQAGIIADLGDDLAGQRARRDFQKANVATDHLRLRPNVLTPRLIHEISAKGHQFLFRCPNCNQLFPRSRPLSTERAQELIGLDLQPDVFFFDRLNAGTVLLAEHFAESGSMVVFEPSRAGRSDWIERAVAVSDLIKHADDQSLNFDEFRWPAHQMRVITAGVHGARYRIGSGKWHESPAFSYPVVDSGGAGDWTTAGLIHALPRTQPWSVRSLGDALRWSQALAAVSCGAPGARGLARQHSASAVLQAAHFLEL